MRTAVASETAVSTGALLSVASKVARVCVRIAGEIAPPQTLPLLRGCRVQDHNGLLRITIPNMYTSIDTATGSESSLKVKRQRINCSSRNFPGHDGRRSFRGRTCPASVSLLRFARSSRSDSMTLISSGVFSGMSYRQTRMALLVYVLAAAKYLASGLIATAKIRPGISGILRTRFASSPI